MHQTAQQHPSHSVFQALGQHATASQFRSRRRQTCIAPPHEQRDTGRSAPADPASPPEGTPPPEFHHSRSPVRHQKAHAGNKRLPGHASHQSRYIINTVISSLRHHHDYHAFCQPPTARYHHPHAAMHNVVARHYTPPTMPEPSPYILLPSRYDIMMRLLPSRTY
jgi:hypothetical protein